MQRGDFCYEKENLYSKLVIEKAIIFIIAFFIYLSHKKWVKTFDIVWLPSTRLY